MSDAEGAASPDHYITAMAQGGPLLFCACRCGGLLTAYPNQIGRVWDQHLRGGRDE